jgi:adenylate cyclase
MQKNKITLIAASCITLTVFVAKYFDVFKSIEVKANNTKYALFNRIRKASDQVVFIQIDDNAIKDLSSIYGSYPWPRRIFKDFIEIIALGNPAGILFDIPLLEKSYNVKPLITDLDKDMKNHDDNALLSSIIENSR